MEKIDFKIPDFLNSDLSKGGKKANAKLVRKRITGKDGVTRTFLVDPNKDKPKGKTTKGPQINQGGPKGKMGRHDSLYGIAKGDAVSIKIKGESVPGQVLYWNANNSTPDGYCVIQLEDGRKIERKQSRIELKTERGGSKEVSSETQNKINTASIQRKIQEEADNDNKDAETIFTTDVNKRFATMEKIVRAVGRRIMKSGIIYGTGGTGKTYTTVKTMEKLGKRPFDEDYHEIGSDNYDYIKITGKVTPAKLFSTLYEHNGKTILFDDCDSFLLNDDAVNVLKGALDTSGDGSIAWNSSVKVKNSEGEEIPKRFKFSGSALFISNLPSNKVPQPLKSRSLRIDMTMSKKQTIERIQFILDKIDFGIPGITKDDKQEALDYLAKNMKITDDINVRTLKSLLVFKSEDPSDWKEDAKMFLLSKSNAIQKNIAGVVVSLDDYAVLNARNGYEDINSLVPVEFEGKTLFVKRGEK